MNSKKKALVNKNIGIQILRSLRNENTWDPIDTRFMSTNQCMNYFQKAIREYFSLGETILVYWNKNTWMNIFADNSLIDMIVFLMQEFNYNKEIEKMNK